MKKLLIWVCMYVLLVSSVALADYQSSQRGKMVYEERERGRSMESMGISELVHYIKEKASMKDLNLVFIDPQTRKQVRLEALAAATENYLKELLASPHNAQTIRTLRNRIAAEKRLSSYRSKLARMEQSRAVASDIRTRNLKTIVTAPVARARVEGDRGRIMRSDVLQATPIITDAQLDNILKMCSYTNYRGPFLTVQGSTDTFNRFLKVDGTPDRDVLKRIINPSRNNGCIKKALRSA